MALDLTLLVEQFTSHALNIIDHLTNNKGVSLYDLNSYSDLMFFRLNFPSINKFSKDYITFLNGNLLYYEDQIINAISAIVVGEILALTLLTLYEIRLWQRIQQYTENVLQLTTRLH
jgi:hypothetical protein